MLLFSESKCRLVQSSLEVYERQVYGILNETYNRTSKTIGPGMIIVTTEAFVPPLIDPWSLVTVLRA